MKKIVVVLQDKKEDVYTYCDKYEGDKGLSISKDRESLILYPWTSIRKVIYEQ